MSDHIVPVVERLLAKAPEWIRHDLLSKDAAARTRAEETLAAMIADALANGMFVDAALPDEDIGTEVRRAT